MNNDLISRKALMEELKKAEEECEDVMCVPSWATALSVIENVPTAYDLDKVVDELYEKAFTAYDTIAVSIDDAIEIVKKGGSDE